MMRESEDEQGVRRRQIPMSTSSPDGTSYSVVGKGRSVSTSSLADGDADNGLLSPRKLKNKRKRHLSVLKLWPHEPEPFLEETGSPFSFLYKSHTISGLAITGLFILYHSFLRAPSPDPLDEIKVGLAIMTVVFLLYCMIQLRDGLLLRPHPAVWRVVHGAGLLYLLALVFILVQSENNARQFLTFFYPDLGKPPAANDLIYASDCRIYTPEQENHFAHVTSAWHDIFIAAHAFGWWAKMVMLRDWRLCWILGILWELLEYSFQHILPNFHECWWDHWLIDLMICNLAGMVLGMVTCRYLEFRRYDWTGASEGPAGIRTHLKRALAQFSPMRWTRYEWSVFSSVRRFFMVAMMIVMMEVVEMNGFFLKYVLWIPPANPLNTMRLLLFCLLSIPALHEWYAYVVAFEKTQTRRLGKDMWLVIAIMGVEFAVCMKFGWRLFMVVPPTPVIWGWTLSAILLLIWVALRFGMAPTLQSGKKKSPWRVTGMNLLFVVALLPLVWLIYTQDVGYGEVGRAILANQTALPHVGA